MKKLTLNREFAVRHLGVALLMLALGGWFAYDGFITYPRQDEVWFTERHLQKENATRRQKEFAVLSLLAALIISGHVGLVAKLRFSWNDEEFEHNGVKRRFSEIKNIDWSKWDKKGIVKVDGIVLDSWHHNGVKEVAQILRQS